MLCHHYALYYFHIRFIILRFDIIKYYILDKVNLTNTITKLIVGSYSNAINTNFL